MIRIVADSVSRAGDRLTTVLALAGADTVARLNRLPHTVTTFPADSLALPFGHHRQVLITGNDPAAAGGLLGDAIRAELGDPAPVADDDLHAPFIPPAERSAGDLSWCGILSAARCDRLGQPGGRGGDLARYHMLLHAPAEQRGGMWHPALPAAAAARPPGVFTGWTTWAELLTWRGDAL